MVPAAQLNINTFFMIVIFLVNMMVTRSASDMNQALLPRRRTQTGDSRRFTLAVSFGFFVSEAGS
jgi:Flp pilus assembly protein protease CpaA